MYRNIHTTISYTTTMRELTVREINQLEERGCSAEDWSEILVDEDFSPASLRNVSFYGHVEIGNLNGAIEIEEGFVRRCQISNAVLRNVQIGDGCLIEDIRGYISGYRIADNCYISDTGIITSQSGADFAQGHVINVLNEGGEGNVVLTPHLTAQTAWLMVNFPDVRKLALRSTIIPQQAEIERGARIVGCKELNNVFVGEGCEVRGATRISNATLCSSDEASTLIGHDVILEDCIIAKGASVTDGSRAYSCFIGESAHIGRGFTAEASLFFANSHMACGESCAAFCGPFSTSHHKSTLLIGGAFSFYNAGSATNQSNHAYKMGPIHWGTLQRGSKTASGSHILWPATIGAFSMVMGKVQSHPQLQNLPFSYVIAQGDKTYVVPGINIRTAGTWRDVQKWPKRDTRPLSAREDIINFDFPNPYILQYVLEAKKVLKNLESQQGTMCEEYEYKGCFIRRKSLVGAMRYYDLIIRLYLWNYFQQSDSADSDALNSSWLDLSGMLAPKSEILSVIEDVKNGSIASLSELQQILVQIHQSYKSNSRQYARSIMQQEGGNMFIDEDYWMREAEEAYSQWKRMVISDAEKEYQLGDVEDDLLRDFISKIEQN